MLSLGGPGPGARGPGPAAGKLEGPAGGMKSLTVTRPGTRFLSILVKGERRRETNDNLKQDRRPRRYYKIVRMIEWLNTQA